jgi:hypothetical protein
MILEICGLLETWANLSQDASLEAKIVHDALIVRQLQDDLKEYRIEVKAAQQLIKEQLYTKSAKSIALALMP